MSSNPIKSAAKHRAGDRVGRFELLEVLGRGAQAVVWRANDQRLDREVALKLLSPDAQSVSVHQWLHEARAVSRLSHPNIVPVFEADEVEGQSYLVFELVSGQTLAAALRRSGAMPERAAAALLLGVLEALRAAHDQGIVHRDLKPSNILLGPDGRPRVMDFGIAARASDGAGHVCGTPGYMSPEAARGLAPTPAMDVYAAGMILGEVLCGHALLVERDAQRALRRTIEEDVVLPESTTIDAGLRAIVLRAVARDAASRFDNVAAMTNALNGWLGAGDSNAVARRHTARWTSCCGACATRAIFQRCPTRWPTSSAWPHRTTKASTAWPPKSSRTSRSRTSCCA
jgi:serine/threonine protein kinase